MNEEADELTIGKVIVRSPEDLKSHTIAMQGEARDFGDFFCVHNIVNRIHQRIKGEENMAKIMKHK